MSFHWKPTNVVPVSSPLPSEDLRHQLQSSEKALNSLKEAHQELLSRFDHLHAERDNFAQQAALWETQQLDYQEEIKNSTFQIRTLEEELNVLHEKLLATESQLTSEQNSAASLQTTLSELERSYQTSQALISHKELEFRDLKVIHSDLHRKVIEQSEIQNAAIVKLQTEVETANLGLKNSEESHELKVQNLKDQIYELSSLLSAEQDNRARIEQSHQELQCRLAQEQEKSLQLSMRQRVIIDLDAIRIRSDPIGTGGEGAIYRGSWCGSPVAIKELRNCRSILESNAFHAELDIPTSIQHPHIIQVFGCGLRSSDNNLYIVMALKDFSLEKVIELESISMLFSVRDRLIIALQILSGLWHLHKHGILHGDLKPENVLLEESSPGKIKVVLADFGRSKELTLTLRKMTSSQVSTLAYSPPEHFEDSSGLKSDIYSFAIILWELTSKKRAWKGKSLPYITNVVYNQNKRPELDHLLDSPQISSIIECCWLREFTQRPSAQEAYKMLKLIIRGPDLSIDSPPIPLPPPPQPPQPGPSHQPAPTQISSSKPLTELINLAIAQLKPSTPSKRYDAIAPHPLFASLFSKLQQRRTIIIQSDSDDDEFN